jgi:hypothetical protein
MKRQMGQGARQIFDREEVEGVLNGSFYAPARGSSPRAAAPADDPKKDKPSHYKVICISMYTDTLERLDAMVRELKARGLTKANRSALIRYALEMVDLDAVPRGM